MVMEKFQYAVDSEDRIYFKYADSTEKRIQFVLDDFRFDEDGDRDLVVDYTVLEEDEGFNRDEFNKDFGLFVESLVVEAVKDAEKAPTIVVE